MNIIVVDFETFYSQEFSLTKVTNEEYVRSEEFEVIGVSVQVDNGEPEWFTGTMAETADFLKTYDWANSLALAHNAAFDASILTWVFGIKPKGWLDTLSMGRALHGTEVGGSLAVLAQHYGVGVKGTEVIMAKGLHRKDFPADQLARYGEYCCNDTAMTYALFQKMSVDFPPIELRLIDLTIRMFSEPSLYLDTRILNTHLRDVREKKANLLGKMMIEKDQLMSNPQLAKILGDFGVVVPMKVSPANGKQTYAFSKTDEGFKALLEHENVLVQAIVAARLGVKSTIEETRTERFIGIASRGAMPVPLRYYAAHTGRWGGDDKLNLQNLPRNSPLKSSIVPADGYVILDSDSSQIEARTLAWLAGQDDLVDAFDRGEDVYKIMASAIYGKPIEEITKDERFVGKTTILGCFGADTLVLTTRGWVPIIHVQATDMVWDGLRWVQHGGVVDQGVKEVWTYKGISATSDHEILTEHGWEAWSEVITKTFLWQSARSVANLLSLSGGHIKPQRVRTVDGTLFANVHVGGSGLSYGKTLLKVVALGATLAPKLRRILNATGRMKAYARMKPHELGSSTVFHPAFPGVTTPTSKHTRTTAVAEYTSMNRGELTGSLFSDTFLRWKGIPLKILSWTGLMWIGGMSRAIFALWGVQPTWQIGVASGACKIGLPPLKQRMQTYDIAYAGPRNRYTILSADGPLVVHNCGYGMGAAKFKLQLKNFGVDVELDEAKRIIDTYRATYPKIVALWAAANNVLKAMLRNAQTSLGRDDLLKVDGKLGILLPNGLRLKYPNLRLREDEESGKVEVVYDTKKGKAVIPNRIYGGKVIENVCQALARIVIGEQMLQIAKKYKVVMTVHDAIAVVVPKAVADTAKEFVEICMRMRPKWAPELPLNCEAGYGGSYGDC